MPKGGCRNKKQVSINAVNTQSLAGAWQGGMLSDFVSWAPPSVLIRQTELYLVILLHFSLLAEKSSLSCCAVGAR